VDEIAQDIKTVFLINLFPLKNSSYKSYLVSYLFNFLHFFIYLCFKRTDFNECIFKILMRILNLTLKLFNNIDQM